MKDLIERLEKATGPDRELDEAIREYVEALSVKHTGPGSGWSKTVYWSEPPAYTASLDAALTLVPDGAHWEIGADNSAMVRIGDMDHCEWGNRAKTPALALCIAALKAREAAKRDLTK